MKIVMDERKIVIAACPISKEFAPLSKKFFNFLEKICSESENCCI
jgi:hypothetical protein